jgi:hypothetical protein
VAYRTSHGDFSGVVPDVGSKAHICFPSDNTPAFIFAFIGEAEAISGTDDGTPARMTAEPEGSPTNVSFRNRAPKLNRGDQAFVTRDGNHLILRRGGVVEIGATPLSKRLYIPIQNFIKDFFENYASHSPAGDLEWGVVRSETDPSGDAPTYWLMDLNEFAQDAKASVRIRHFSATSGEKKAWSIDIAPQGIDRETGEIVGSVYSFSVSLEGDQEETITGSRQIVVEGDDTLTVNGSSSMSVRGDYSVDARGGGKLKAGGVLDLEGSSIRIGGPDASQPPVLGQELIRWLSSATWVVAGTAATVDPASLASLAQILSTKVRIK